MSRACDRILPLVEGGRQVGTNRWKAQCPAHRDRNPSLSIRQTEDRALVKCWAGCATSEIVAAIGLTLADLFDDQREGFKPPDPKAQRKARADLDLSSGAQRL